MSATRAGAQQRLMSELASLQKENWVHIHEKTVSMTSHAPLSLSLADSANSHG